ncbi:hypothetical protein TrCOL_g10324 [Triparma columacea]|uniref:Uncharacterized protein n=1 Tax=Triparma columacea TaxID=722753 RepID=A0A9W7L1M1_9STRA|nr:hypothetical protein TrCOL_g10324 [Triparma columacea]
MALLSSARCFFIDLPSTSCRIHQRTGAGRLRTVGLSPPRTRSLLFSTRTELGWGAQNTAIRSTNEAGGMREVGGKGTSLFQKIDNFGLSLKGLAMDAKVKAKEAEERWQKILLSTKFCGILALFIIYRAYRGFFVILPSVFREVERKLSKTMDFAPYEDDSIAEATTKTIRIFKGEGGAGGVEDKVIEDINPETGKVRPRTTITVSVLAGLITLSYIIRGMAGVVFKFVQTAFGKRSIVNSFEAAADEVVKNEGRVMRVVDNVDDCEM